MIARMHTDSGLYFRRGGTGGPTLLLLHGLGAAGEVWHGLEEVLRERWPGSWIVPDLPGHGRSTQDAPYSFGRMAAAIAEIDADSSHLVVLGHSLGGVLGLALGSGWFGEPVEAVCGLGIKVRWSPEELVKAAELAAKPARLFATREQAAQRWLKVAGLHELWGPDAPRIDAGLIEAEGGWYTALDQRAFAVGEPDMRGLLAASRAKSSWRQEKTTRCARRSTCARCNPMRPCSPDSATTRTSKIRPRSGRCWSACSPPADVVASMT
jgi:pimeloyl-ACP methyl ester carboxylesterase